MKPYFSYWSPGYKKIDSQTIDLIKLSTFFAKKHYGQIHLITDSKGYNRLKDVCNWDSISKDLDTLPVDYSEVWSLGKIKTFEIASRRKEQFIHLDFDVILWKKLPKFIEEADIFCQSREGHVTEWDCVNRLYELENRGYIENHIKPYISPNCGIIGGKNFEFINQYSMSALNMVFNKKNEWFWKFYKGYHFEKAVLAEQYYLAICAEYFEKDIVYLLNDGSDKECEQIGYTHLLGAKNDPLTAYKIKEALDKLNIK